MGTAINVVGMGDIERPLPLTGKLHFPKEFFSVFKTKSSGTCLVFASSHGFSTLPSKSTVRESPPTSAKQVIRTGSRVPLEPVFETGSKGSVLKSKAFRTGSPRTGSKLAPARPRGCTAAQGLGHLYHRLLTKTGSK